MWVWHFTQPPVCDRGCLCPDVGLCVFAVWSWSRTCCGQIGVSLQDGFPQQAHVRANLMGVNRSPTVRDCQEHGGGRRTPLACKPQHGEPCVTAFASLGLARLIVQYSGFRLSHDPFGLPLAHRVSCAYRTSLWQVVSHVAFAHHMQVRRVGGSGRAPGREMASDASGDRGIDRGVTLQPKVWLRQ